ncbi:TlpA family protein disulfide reductase [Mycetocola tolaasinivorans]|uniref:TlpA family protein disulfide reductase n=1 Tax=Mycetocola tolaasinivorans TaxID=76635 RepID=A0A3L7A6G8_9MICO|nr:TlpA family protein disulfide reductase [Mycetocola tolaasinivorans]
MAVGAAALALALTLSGCANEKLAADYTSADNKNYVAGDGSVTEVAAADREKPVEYSGKDEHGKTISSKDLLGEVVVMNYWYAGCAPCRAEAPDLQALNEKYDGKGAQFVGVNVFDQAETALAFNKTYGITYPSILDVNDGSVKLAFTGQVRPNAVPTTLVIDKQGRVAARILGKISDRSILDTLIRDAIAE